MEKVAVGFGFRVNWQGLDIKLVWGWGTEGGEKVRTTAPGVGYWRQVSAACRTRGRVRSS